jgi:hypothetical protein
MLTLLANALENACRTDLSKEELLKVKVKKKEDLKKKERKNLKTPVVETTSVLFLRNYFKNK